MSGGSSLSTLRGSFVASFLPVELKGLKQIDTLSDALPEQFGFQSSGSKGTLFECIEFVPRAGMRNIDRYGGTDLRCETEIWEMDRSFALRLITMHHHFQNRRWVRHSGANF